MIRRTSLVIALGLAASAALVVPTASAGAASPVNVAGQQYRGGIPSRGGVDYAAGLQFSRDASGAISRVRAVGRITKIRSVKAVQVDRVALGTARGAVKVNGTPKNSGSAGTATSYTGWQPVRAGTCTSYRARVNYSMRWSDNAVSHFSVLSPAVMFCGKAIQHTAPKPPTPPTQPTHPTPPARPADRDCSDFSTHAQAQAFFEHYYPYYGDFSRLDADHDMLACETLP